MACEMSGKTMAHRLLLNACSTYGRLLVTFILGLFTTWYITLNLGFQGLGLVGLAAGSFGLSIALERGSDAAIGRELAEAIAKRDRAEISRVSAATFAVCVLLGLLVVGITLVLIPVILSGTLNLEMQGDNVQRAFSMLLLCEGLAGALKIMGTLWRKACFASRNILIDNVLMILDRVGRPVVLLIVFNTLDGGGQISAVLIWIGLGTLVWGALYVAATALVSRRLVPEVRFSKSDFNRSLIIQTVKNAVWALQFSLVSGFLAQLLGIVVNLTLGLTFNGIWSIVIQLAGWCMLLSEGLFRGIDPLMIHLKEERGIEGVRSRLPLLTSIQGYVAVAITGGMVCISPWFLNVWLGARLQAVSESSEFANKEGGMIVFISNMLILQLGGILVRTACSPLERTLFGLGHVRHYVPFVWIGGCVAVFCSFLPSLDGQFFWVPLGFMLANGCSYGIGVLRASSRTIGLQIARDLQPSLIKIFVVTAATWGYAMVFRISEGQTLPSMAITLIGLGVLWAVMVAVTDRSLRMLVSKRQVANG